MSAMHGASPCRTGPAFWKRFAGHAEGLAVGTIVPGTARTLMALFNGRRKWTVDWPSITTRGLASRCASGPGRPLLPEFHGREVRLGADLKEFSAGSERTRHWR